MNKFLASFGYGVVGLVLATVGLVIISNKQDSSAVKVAAADTGYTTDWEATKVYRLKLNGSTQINAIGVAEWKVTGENSTKTVRWDETWTGPNPADTSYRATSGAVTCTHVGSEWLSGCLSYQKGGNANTILQITKEDVGSVNNGGKITGPNGDVTVASGDTVVCIPSSGPCFSTTGAYGWIFTEPAGLPSNSAMLGAGMFMPLKWHVVGVLHD